MTYQTQNLKSRENVLWKKLDSWGMTWDCPRILTSWSWSWIWSIRMDFSSQCNNNKCFESLRFLRGFCPLLHLNVLTGPSLDIRSSGPWRIGGFYTLPSLIMMTGQSVGISSNGPWRIGFDHCRCCPLVWGCWQYIDGGPPRIGEFGPNVVSMYFVPCVCTVYLVLGNVYSLWIWSTRSSVLIYYQDISNS